MVYELEDTSKVKGLFAGWQETLITSCLQKIMGRIFVTDLNETKSAFAFVGCFGFFAGEPDLELLKSKPEGFTILTPRNRQWAVLIESTYPDAKKVTRYAIRKDARFDVNALKNNLLLIPDGYELKEIDADLYDKCMESSITADFVSSFECKEAYLKTWQGHGGHQERRNRIRRFLLYAIQRRNRD